MNLYFLGGGGGLAFFCKRTLVAAYTSKYGIPLGLIYGMSSELEALIKTAGTSNAHTTFTVAFVPS